MNSLVIVTTSARGWVDCGDAFGQAAGFEAVAVVACDDDVRRPRARMKEAADETELDEVHQTERHLLYVACTRARDALVVSGVAPASEFLDDMNGAS